MTSMFPYRDSLLFCQGQFLFSLQLFVLQSYCTLKVYINFLGAYLVLYPWILLAYWKWFWSRSTQAGLHKIVKILITIQSRCNACQSSKVFSTIRGYLKCAVVHHHRIMYFCSMPLSNFCSTVDRLFWLVSKIELYWSLLLALQLTGKSRLKW